jgi:hypothetical protein
MPTAQIREQTQYRIVIENPLKIARHGPRQSKEANPSPRRVDIEQHTLPASPQ